MLSVSVMGKSAEEVALPVAADENADTRCPQCRPIGKIVSLRCVAALVLSAAVLISAVFWLPPFIRGSHGGRGRHRGEAYGADIVARFRLQKPVSQLKANISQLQYDIFYEIGVPNSMVALVSLEPLTGLNMTNVVFGIWPYPLNSTISSAGISIIRSSFVSLVVQQTTLHLTTPLFGNSSDFQVLKFPGGMTITPAQIAFPLQKEHYLFSFTLNFSIYQVQDKINELKDQMKLGLLLNSYENLFVTLTNLNGSTIARPTIVQTFIILAVGNRQPSVPRLKQLAQTIANSSAGNLGLNHTVFGRVKQIRLSSYLQHSVSTGPSLSPSPSPHPPPEHHHHHHHHHHHRHHDPNMHVAPSPAPRGAAPSGCHNVVSSKPKGIVPGSAPVPSLHHSFASAPNEDPPASAPPVPSASPLPDVVFAHTQPPSESAVDFKLLPTGNPSISPSQFSSSHAGRPFVGRTFCLVLLLYLFTSW